MNNKLTFWKFISNPFEKIAGIKAFVIGILAILTTAFIGSMSGTAFDGVIDMHFYPHSLLYAVSTQILSWIILVLLMFTAGKIASKAKIRFIDMAGTLAFARIPFFPLAFLGFIPAFQDLITDIFSKLPLILILAFVSIIFIGWAIYWMYRAFSVSSNLKKPIHIVIFIVALMLAETCAVVAIQYGLKNYIPTGTKQEQSVPVVGEKRDNAYNKTREIVELIETNDIDKIISSFDSSTRKALPANKLLNMWEQAQRQFGKFQGFEDDTKVSEKGGVIMTETTVRFDKIKLCLQLTFDGNGQVGGFFIKPLLF